MEEIKFGKNLELFNQNLSTGIEFTSEADKDIVAAVAGNQPLSSLDLSKPKLIGEGGVTANGNKNFEFKGNSKLEIGGSAGADIRLGIFGSSAEVLSNLEEEDGLKVAEDTLAAGSVYVLFSTGYELSASAKAEWILAKGSLNASVSGQKDKRYVVLRAFEPDHSVKDAIADTISELRLPKQIQSPGDLEPGTTLIIESNGAISAQVGAQLGYDFNWLYESNLEQLEGTVGLHLKFGASLAMAFEDAGIYALTVSRKTDSKYVDLQLVKQRKKMTSFAMSLAASAQGNFEDFEDIKLHDLIKATLGVHHGQVMKQWKTVKEWTNPEELEEKVKELSEDLVKRLAAPVKLPLEKARAKILDLLKQWDKIGDEAGATLWQLLDQQANNHLDLNLEAIKGDFNDLIEITESPESIQGFLDEKLEKIGVSDTAFGKLLNAILPTEDLLESFSDSELFDDLQERAQSFKDLLDFGDDIEHFHKALNDELKLDKITKALETNSVDDLGELMASKLSDLVIDNGKILTDELQKVHDFIKHIEDKADDILEKTKKALQREYGVSFAATIQRQREEEALVHASFKLGDEVADDLFAKALEGTYNELFTQIHGEAVKLRRGSLSHRVSKSTSISLSLPFMKRDFTHINESLASGNFVDEQDGRLIMYEFKAKDTIKRSRRLSQLALEGQYKVLKRKDGSRQTDRDLKMAYSFRLAKRKMATSHLEQIIEPFFKLYLPDVFDKEDSDTQLSPGQWISEMDAKIEEVNKNGKRTFGTTLLNLELRIPSAIGAAWFHAPDSIPEYKGVSTKIQQRLREILPLYFFENEKVIGDEDLEAKVYGMMTYQACPTKNDFVFDRGILERHWKWQMPTEVARMVRSNHTKQNLLNVIKGMHLRFKDDPEVRIRKKARRFGDNPIALMNFIISRASSDNDEVYGFLTGLFLMEQKIIAKTVEAGLKLAKFVKDSDQKPNEAVEGLEQFGSEITEALNNLSGFGAIASKGDYTRYLSTELFVAVAEAFEPGLKVDIDGMFEILVLKKKPEFEYKSYLEGAMPKPEDLIISSRVFDMD